MNSKLIERNIEHVNTDEKKVIDVDGVLVVANCE